MAPVNPYAPPIAEVADVAGQDAPQPVKIWSARGRIGRLRYLAYQAVAYVVFSVVAGLGGGLAVILQAPSWMMATLVLGGAAYFVLLLLLTIQRCHDIDWTGWASLLLFVPLVGLLFWFVSGTAGSNRFGAPPPPNGTGIKVMAWLGVGVLVLAMVGVVAAIAVPAYQDYGQRARAAQSR